MGRELRRVPENWEHPRKDNGNYQPMFNSFYLDAFNYWLEENEQWNNGTHSDLIRGVATKEEYPFYSMWAGNPPCVEYYQTKQYTEDELTHIQLYEDTTEGTPCSPVFKADEIEKLCEYAAENCTTFGSNTTTKENWLKMLSGGFVSHTEGNVVFF